MNYDVFIIKDAEEDLLEIYEYVVINDSPGKADKLLDNLERSCQSLSTLSNREHVPPELEQIGIFEYKEINYKPYRIIYQILELKIYIHCILDGRRNLQQILQEKLLR